MTDRTRYPDIFTSQLPQICLRLCGAHLNSENYDRIDKFIGGVIFDLWIHQGRPLPQVMRMLQSGRALGLEAEFAMAPPVDLLDLFVVLEDWEWGLKSDAPLNPLDLSEFPARVQA